MTTTTTKRNGRSRELDYYYRRRERGDHLFRFWADGDTARKFVQLFDAAERSEDVFKRLVDNAYAEEGLG